MNSLNNGNRLKTPINLILAFVGRNKGLLLAFLDFLSIITIFISSYYIRAHLSQQFDFFVDLPEIDQYIRPAFSWA